MNTTENYPVALPLDKQVKELMKRCKIIEIALKEALSLLSDMIEVNKKLRKLCKLPKKKYPTAMSVGNHEWRI